MLKVGDRVKFVDNIKLVDIIGPAYNNKRGVLGTVTEIHTAAGVPLARVIWDDGQTMCQFESHLEKYEEKCEQKMKETEASEYQKHLMAIYENTMFTDFTIICKAGGKEYKFPCHKAVIASGSASGHFARMFGSGMTECSSGEVEVEGYEKEEVEQFIKFLYTLKLEEEGLEKHSVKFLKMADQYDVPKMKADVTNFLRSRLTKDTVLDIVLAAHSYGAPELKSAAIDFIVKNKLEEKSLAEWKLALKGHEDLLFDIFSAVHKK